MESQIRLIIANGEWTHWRGSRCLRFGLRGGVVIDSVVKIIEVDITHAAMVREPLFIPLVVIFRLAGVKSYKIVEIVVRICRRRCMAVSKGDLIVDDQIFLRIVVITVAIAFNHHRVL